MKRTINHRAEISIAEIIKKFKLKNAPDDVKHLHVSCLHPHANDPEFKQTPLPESTDAIVIAWATEEKSDDE